MLAIRLQRTGRSGHAQFRVIVQDSRFSPKRGRVVAYIGSYDPHTKTAVIDSAKAAQYLQNGAQPSDRVARLFKKESIKLPAWVKLDEPQERDVRYPEKRRSTRPAGVEAPAPAADEPEPPADTAAEGEPAAAAPESAPAAEEESPAVQDPAEPALGAESAPAETPAEADKPAENAAEDGSAALSE